MATVPAPPKTTPSAKYDAIVAVHLARAERRVRMLDLAVGLLGFLALSLVYVLVMVLLHWKLQLPTVVRQLFLIGYLLGTGAFLTWQVVLPFRRPINPRFAALQLERTLSGAKNSVVNFIDLRDDNLPPAIRSALGRRAAKDAGQADVEQAIPGRKAGWAGGIAALVALLCIVSMFAVGFREFFQLLGGVFVPLNPTMSTLAVPQKNRVSVLQPAEENYKVAAGNAVAFTVHVEGELASDDTPKLILTYTDPKKTSNETLVRPLVKPRTPGGDWTAQVSATEVREGFVYKVTAGDAESIEKRVTTVFSPAVTQFQAVYLYPTYLGEPHKKVQTVNRRLHAWRGTEVQLRVQTNGTVLDALVEVKGKDEKPTKHAATIAADDSEAFEVRFRIEEKGTYRLRFTSASLGETYMDELSHDIIVDEDRPPHKVELTSPGKEISLPTTGLLKVEGVAEDDVGVKSLTLVMKTIDGKAETWLLGKTYRSDEELRLPGTEAQVKRGGHGGYLKNLDYKDSVDLKTVQTPDGKPYKLKAGTELEYWLEARDACDYPGPNPAVESKHFRIKLTEPERNPQQEKKEKEERKQDRQEKGAHEKKQNKELQQEEQKRKDEQQSEEKKEQDGKKGEPKSGNASEEKKPGGADQQPKPEDGKANDKNENDKNGEENQRRSEPAKPGPGEPRDKPKDEQDPKGKAKDSKPNPAENKPADPKQDGKQGEKQPNDKGDGKPEPKPDEKKQAGQSKECKNPGQQGEGKEGGKEDPKDGPKGDGKSGAAESMGKKGEQPGEAKNDAPPKPTAGKGGEGKPGDPKQGDGKAAEGKTGGMGQAQAKDQPQAKEAGADGKVADGKPTGDAKDQQPDKGSPSGATAKDGGKKELDPKAQASGKDTGTGKSQGEKKTDPSQAKGEQTAGAKGKPEKSNDAGGDVSKIDPKKPSTKDLDNLVKALRDGDEKKVGDALKKLEEVGEKAEDPNVREAAKNLNDALEKFVQDQQEKERKQAGGAKAGSTPPPPRPETPPEARIARSKEGATAEDRKDSAASKEEGKPNPGAKKGMEKGKGRKDTTVDPMTPPSEGENFDPTQATVKGPKMPLGRNAHDTDEARNPDEPVKPSNPLKQPNSTLQLESFDPEKYRNKGEEVVAKPKPRNDPKQMPTKEPGEKLDPSKSGPLNPTVGRKTDPKSTTTDAIDAGRGTPPPGYRKTVPEFTKIRAQPEDEKKDQK